jgi:hypothetical protein
VATGLSDDETAERRFVTPVTPVTAETHADRAMAGQASVRAGSRQPGRGKWQV